MEGKPWGINGDSKIERILDGITKKLEGSYKINGSSTRSNEDIVRQKKKKSTKTKDWKQHVVRSQEYSFEQTFKEVGSKKIWTL